MSKSQSTSNRILNFLQQNPTATRADIEEILDLKKPTVQRHVKKLVDLDLVKEGFILNADGAKEKFHFWIMIATQFPQSQKKRTKDKDFNYQDELCREIQEVLQSDKSNWCEHISVIDISIVLSAPWDIMLSGNSGSFEAVGDFVVKFLRTNEMVAHTTTTWRAPSSGAPPISFSQAKAIE